MPSEIDAGKIRRAKALEAYEKARRKEALKAKAEKDQLPEQATAADKDAKQNREIVDIEAADLEAGAESEPDNFNEPPAAPEAIGSPG